MTLIVVIHVAIKVSMDGDTTALVCLLSSWTLLFYDTLYKKLDED